MPTRALGLTGVNVPLFSLGGQGLLEIPGRTDEAAAIINRAIDLGVKYCDTAWWYGHGSSESYGATLGARRNDIYLATKSDERTYDGAMRQLDESLKRLKTDRLDCWQMHNVRTSQDVEAIFASDGALKAFMEARDEKVTRFIGITGHRNPFVLMGAMGYVLTLRVSTVIIGIKTVAELEENVRIAQGFKPFGPEAVAGLEDLTRPYYEEATFFKRRKGY